MKTKTRTIDPVQQMKRDGEQAARKAAFNPVTEKLMRVGFAARGLIYFMIGLLAIQVAIGGRSGAVDQQGAIEAVGRTPFGRLLLAIIIIGLFGYALWGIIRAIYDPFHKGKDLKGLVQRIGYVFSAISYAALIPPAYFSIVGGARAAHSGAQTNQSQHFTALLLSKPGGRWVIGMIGIIGLLGGLYQVYLGLRPKFEKQFQTYALNRDQTYWMIRLGRFGTTARGIVFSLVGLFLFLAAYHSNPNQAQGIDGALMALSRQPYGIWLLGIVALGLIAFGIYSAMGALWFRLQR